MDIDVRAAGQHRLRRLYVRGEEERWRKLISDANIRIE
jgi:hypothetical protein